MVLIAHTLPIGSRIVEDMLWARILFQMSCIEVLLQCDCHSSILHT